MHVGDDRRDDSTSNPSARYTDEFRRETADYIISTGRPITQCRSELGLNSNTVRKWSRTAAASLRASPIREVLSARQVLGPHSVQGARAGDTRPHAQRREAHTIPNPKARRRPDLVRHDFNSPVPTYKLVGDITYLRTREGRLYLSTVIDPNTHMVVAGRSPRDLTADIAVSASASAKSRGYVTGNAIFHADRGAQHASRLLSEWARDNDVRLTCSRTAPAAATTTRWPSRSSPRLRMRCITGEASRPGTRQACGDRVHRGVLQPPQAPLDDRLQGAGRGYGRALRTHSAQARRAPHGRLISRARVSEILTQVTPLILHLVTQSQDESSN
ncbi:DDE-type integrase/transposase/recombinase [Senegalimassilia anaerobia]|uniref:DDE-type integrase/transposase/recombinase n=1 Tax=Senegalimassilia anaerobia TaxID=1473216 RepID=UPI00350E5875